MRLTEERGEEVVMRIVGCGLIAVAALLGLAPTAMASESAAGPSGSSVEMMSSTSSVAHPVAQRQPEPHNEVSMLAVSLTAGAAVAAAGSGVAQAVNRRRALSRAARHTTRDTVRL
jgi:hypothetical protein